MKGKQLSVIFGQARIKVSLDKLRYLSDWNLTYITHQSLEIP
jgi:hypothetical protein